MHHQAFIETYCGPRSQPEPISLTKGPLVTLLSNSFPSIPTWQEIILFTNCALTLFMFDSLSESPSVVKSMGLTQDVRVLCRVPADGIDEGRRERRCL